MGRGIAFRRWRKWAVVLAIFAIGIPVSAALTIRSSQAHTRLRGLLIDGIRDELGLRAALGRVQIQLSPFALVARDIALDDPVYGRIADAERIEVQPSLFALLRGQIDLEAITLEGAHVNLVVRDGQVRNLPRIEGGGGGGEITLPFGELAIRNASLSVDAEPIASGTLEHVDVTVRGGGPGVIEASARVPEGAITRAGVEHRLEQLEARVEITRDMLRVHALDLALGPLRLGVGDATVPLPPPDPRALGAPAYRGEIALDYDLAHLATLALPITLPRLEGRVAVRARVSHDPTHGPRASGVVRVEDGQIEEFGIGDVVQLTVSADVDEVRIESGEVQVVGNGGRIGLTGTLGLSPDLPLDARAELHGLSFAHLMEELSVSDSSLVEWIFEGSMVLRGSLRDLSLEGPVDLRTHDFFVSAGGYNERPLRTVIAIPRGHFRGSWSIRNDAIRFTDLVADLPRSRIFGDVLLGFHNELGVNVRAEADLRDVSPLTRFRMAGVGTATCVIDGIYQAPNVRGHLDIADFVFDTFRLGHVQSDAVLDPDGKGVTFPHIVASKNASRYTGDNVYLDFHRDAFRMSGRIGLEEMHLADFYHVFGFEADERFTPYQGIARGDADVVYSNGYPGDSPSGTLDVGLALTLADASVDDYRFERGELAGRFRWLDWSRGIAGAELDIEHASLHKGEGTIAIAGTMELGGALRLTAAADAIALRDVEGLGDRFPGLDGIASATAQIGGTPDLMRMDLDVGLTNVVYAGRAIGDGRAYVRQTHQGDAWVQDALAWEGAAPPEEDCALARGGLARANWPSDPPLRTVDGPQPRASRPSAFVICGEALDGRMQIDLAVGRTQQYPLRGRIALDGLDLTPFLPGAAQPGASTPRGKVSGELVLEDGGLRDLATLAGRLELSELEVGRGDLVFTNQGSLVVSLKNGVASVDRARLVGPDSQIRAQGQYALPTAHTDGGLALAIDGRVDLGMLARISPAITEAQGALVTHLAISGPIADPEIYGDARLVDGMLRAAALPTPVDDLDARVTFSARSIQIDEVRARLAGGTVRGRGEARIADGRLSEWSLRISGHDLALAPAEGLDVSLGADVEVGWARGERLPTATGELRVQHLAFSRNIDLGTTLGELSRTQRAEVQRYDPDADRVVLDLRIVDEQPFVVRNNLVEAELTIDDSQRPFRIVGTDQRFGVLGNMEFTRGRIFFRNAIFELQRGSLSFDDETRIDPSFQLGAVTELRRSGDLAAARWRILLDARGSLDSFQIGTRADPDLPQEDILMLLAVGMTRSEFEQLQTGDTVSTGALEALTYVTGVDREVRRAVPLIDDFRISSAYSLRSGRTEPQISVGKRIADRVRLSATTGVGAGDARDFRALVDVQLDDTTGVQCSYDNFGSTGSASTFGNVGCDLRWRLEFE